ncbi:MAG: dUTP diphosphatase [Actinomycetota bacterium]|jgi:dUTP pyrophosphatase|nr:dUTP diphosphatase [Actinomycetota bacterium]
MRIKLKQLDKELPTPRPVHDGDAGVDLFSRIDTTLKPGERALVPTGIAIAIPHGYAGFVQPRSGLALNHGISIVNTPGLIDSEYRGEVGVILINLNREKDFEVRRGDKIAQLVIQRIETIDFETVDELDNTRRGSGGFGSSGR